MTFKLKKVDDHNGYGDIGSKPLFLEDHVYAHDGGQDQLADFAVMRDLFRNVQHVIVCRGKKFLAQPGPFLGHVGELDPVISQELEVPPSPFPLQGTDGIVLPVQQGEFASDGKKLLLESTNSHVCLVQHVDFGKKDGNPALDPDYGLTPGRLDLNVEWSHSLVVGKTKHLREKTELFLTAVQNDFATFRIKDVEIIGRLENPGMFLNKKGIFIENWIHVELLKLLRTKGNP